MFLGMPGPVANGTNRITIVAHNASAIATYLRHGVPHAKLRTPPQLRFLRHYSVLGSVHDSITSSEGLLAFVMVAVLLLMQAPKAKRMHQQKISPRTLLWVMLMAMRGFGEVSSNWHGLCRATHRIVSLGSASLARTSLKYLLFTTPLAIFVLQHQRGAR